MRLVPYILKSLYFCLSALNLETLTYRYFFYLKTDILLCDSPKLIYINSVKLSNPFLLLTRVLVRISERKRQFTKSRLRLEDYIVKDFKEIGWHNVELIYLSQNRPSEGLSFQILSSPRITCVVRFDLRASSLNKPRDKAFYSFGTHNKVPPCIAMLYMSWFMGPEAEKGLAIVLKSHERFPARNALVPGISSGSGERVLD